MQAPKSGAAQNKKKKTEGKYWAIKLVVKLEQLDRECTECICLVRA